MSKVELNGKTYDLSDSRSRLRYWNAKAESLLLGRTIDDVEYIKDGDFGRILAIKLDNGAIVFPMRDDEGNGPGALHFEGTEECEILPELR